MMSGLSTLITIADLRNTEPPNGLQLIRHTCTVLMNMQDDILSDKRNKRSTYGRV